ncbi:MAG: nucleotidyltransferase/DNA polymerase involved in DNA repair [uncultured archaeon A07HN63]|nr:MAG: nucleotidyltransferase/DNA polymerase involved in DNA repair [uncultured archaeon A07HN63]
MVGVTFDAFTDTERDDEPRIILHVDMDCFYASCERLREPTLRGEPVIVGMGYEAGESHGAVATASYEAREYGIESAQAISEALELLPRAEDDADGESVESDPEAADSDQTDSDDDAGYYRPVDLDFYEDVAGDVKEILQESADVVREVSIDEAYLDVTNRTSWDRVDDGNDTEGDADATATADSRTIAEGYARHVRQRIAREVGVPASVGVAPNMATAKIASDHDKPDGLTVVPPGAVEDFLAPLSVEAIHGVGPVTASELREMDIETAGDLAHADPAALVDRFGERGRAIYDRARGDDDRAVTPTGRPKSLSRESAFTEATADSEAKRERLAALAADVASRARSRDAMYRTVGIKVVTPPFDINTRAASLPGPVDDPDLVESIALDLLAEFADSEVRKLGVRVSNLHFGARDQSTLDGFESDGDLDSLRESAASDWSESVTTTETDAPLTEWTTDGDGDADARSDDDSDTAPSERSGQSSLGEFD